MLFISKISKVVKNFNSTLVRQQNHRCNYTMFQLKFSLGMCCIQYFANFTIGNETGHFLEFVELYGKFINKSKTYHMLRGNIAATSLKN